MANNVSQNYVVGGIVQVAEPGLGGNPIDVIRRSFSASGQAQLGDLRMDQARGLLLTNFPLMEPNDQGISTLSYQKLKKTKEELRSHNGSQLKKLFLARNYRRTSEKTLKTVKAASDRAMDDILNHQFEEAINPPGGGPGSSGITPIARDPFTDSHEVLTPTLTDVDADDQDQVDMQTYRAEATEEFDAQDQPRPVQLVAATPPTQAVSGDSLRADERATEVPVDLRFRQDSTMPHVVTASIPVNHRLRASEEETRIVASVSSADLFGALEGRCLGIDPYRRQFSS